MSKSIHIYGFHSIEAQINSHPEYVLKVFIQSGRHDSRMSKMTSLLSNLKINPLIIDKKELNHMVNGELHQGIVAEVLLPSFSGQKALINFIENLSSNPLILILDSVQDPRNLGACLRCAHAAGADCVVVNKDGSAPINAVVYKTSVGVINKLKIFQVTNLVRTIKSLQAQELWVIGLETETTTSIYDINLTSPTVIVMGAEGKGLRQLTMKTCDQLAHIPMSGNIDSLNVSVATGITLFEVRRQRLSKRQSS